MKISPRIRFLVTGTTRLLVAILAYAVRAATTLCVRQLLSPWPAESQPSSVRSAANGSPWLSEGAVRGASRPEPNMLRAITGDFAQTDRDSLQLLQQVLQAA
jgi:hypothetical protein